MLAGNGNLDLKKGNAERANGFAADGFCCGYRVAVRDRFLVRDETDVRNPRFDKPGVRDCHRDARLVLYLEPVSLPNVGKW